MNSTQILALVFLAWTVYCLGAFVAADNHSVKGKAALPIFIWPLVGLVLAIAVLA